MSRKSLTKGLYGDITRLKLLHAKSTPKFLLDRSPFDEDEDDDEQTLLSRSDLDRIVITGRILPDSEIYNQGAYQIEMRLTTQYPFDPPEVRFKTRIYHPNVCPDGKIDSFLVLFSEHFHPIFKGEFCHELLKKTAKWTNRTPLVDVITAVTKHIDEPDIEFSLSFGTFFILHLIDRNKIFFRTWQGIPGEPC